MAAFPLIDWIALGVIAAVGLAAMCGLAWWLERGAPHIPLSGDTDNEDGA